MSDRAVTRNEKAYREIKRMILEGRWQPGERLSTYELASQLGISRTPIMEAIKKLEREGFLVVEPQVGCVLKLPDRDEMHESFLMRAALEGLAAKIAAEVASPEDIAVLEHALDHARMMRRVCDKPGYLKTNGEFHVGVARAAHLPNLQQLIKHLWERSVYFTGSALFIAGRQEESLAEHTAVVEAIKNKNGKLARQLMEEHLRNGGQAVLTFMDKDISVQENKNFRLDR